MCIYNDRTTRAVCFALARMLGIVTIIRILIYIARSYDMSFVVDTLPPVTTGKSAVVREWAGGCRRAGRLGPTPAVSAHAWGVESVRNTPGI